MHDFIAIGDTAVDAFIKLKDAKVVCDINKIHCTITLSFGDKIPYESVEEVPAVGNAANASVSAGRLGLSTALVTNLGDDDLGKASLESLKKDNVDTRFIKVETSKKTNYHYVLWYEDDRTILVKHEDYDYSLPELNTPRWLYLSSLGPKTIPFHRAIEHYLEDQPEVNLAFQPGTFQISEILELRSLLKRTAIFFCNVDEAGRILKTASTDVEKLLKGLYEFGPKVVVVTNGPRGAHVYDGTDIRHQSAYPDPKPPFERTGAGDALASTTVAALCLGKDLETALKWGMINAMSVVQQVGAQKGLLTRPEIEEYLKLAF